MIIPIIIIAVIAISVLLCFKYKNKIIQNKKKVITIAAATSVIAAGSLILPQSSIIISAELIDDYSVYEKYGYDIDKIDNPILYKSQVLTEGHLPLVITVNTSSMVNITNSNEISNFVSYIEIDNLNFKILDSHINILIPYEYEYEEFIYEEELKITEDENGTEIIEKELKIVDSIKIKETRYKWIDINDISNLEIKEEETFVIDIIGHFEAKTGNREVDIIPRINVNGYEKTFPEFAWWNSNWGRRIDLYVNASQVLENLVNFPILVHIKENSSIYTYTQDDLDDIAFVDTTNTTQFNHQIESFIKENNVANASIWVNMTSVSSSVDTHFNLYYNNSDCVSQQDIENTWDSGYEAVWHLNETTGSYYDSTSNNHDGTLIDVNTNSVRGATGKVGECISFSGDAQPNGDYIDTGGNVFEYNTFTLEMFINYDGDGVEPARGMWRIADLNDDNNGYNLFIQQDSEPNSVQIYQHYGGGSADYIGSGMSNTLNVWQYYAHNVNGSAECFSWLNGSIAETDTLTNNVTFGNTNSAIGEYDAENERFFDGEIDEVRYSNIYRNKSWVSSSYNTMTNQSGDDSFIIWGDVSLRNTAPEITNPVPANQSECINCSQFINLQVNDSEGDDMNLTFRANDSGIWEVFGTNLSVNNGTYGHYNANFTKCNTTFYWNVTVDDGYNIIVSETYHFTTIRESEITMDYPTNGSNQIPLTPQINITANDLCSEDMDIYWYENTTGVWLLMQTNLSVNNGTYRYVYTNASAYETKYWIAINVSNSCCHINETFWFITETPLEIHNITVRTNDTGFFCFRGFNTTAANFTNGNITGFDEADEYISVWKNASWDNDSWMWINYYGDGNGTDFDLRRFDIIRIHLNDSDTTTLVWMNDTIIDCNCSGVSIDLKYSTNRGYNYTCLCVNISGTAYTTLKAIALQSPLETGESIAWWNNAYYRWESWIIGHTPDELNYNINSYDVFETKVSTDRTWVLP
jgi:hypothetical protein